MEGRDDAAVRLGEEFAAHPLRAVAVGAEQLVDEAFARLAPAGSLGLGEIAQIHRVAFEIEHGEPRRVAVDPLPVAVDQDEARPLRGPHQDAPLGHHRDRPLRGAGVVHEDAVERAALAPANVDRHAIAQRVEGALLQEERRMVAAQDELPLLELPVADRHDVHDDRVGDDDDDGRHQQGRLRQRPLTDSGGTQADQLAVDGEPVVDEEQRAEERNRQYRPQEGRQNQHAHQHEGAERQALVDDQVDDPQRLRQPDDCRKPQRDEHEGAQELTQEIALVTRHGPL